MINWDNLKILRIYLYYLGSLGVTCNYLGLLRIILYFLQITWRLLCNYSGNTSDSDMHLGMILVIVFKINN